MGFEAPFHTQCLNFGASPTITSYRFWGSSLSRMSLIRHQSHYCVRQGMNFEASWLHKGTRRRGTSTPVRGKPLTAYMKYNFRTVKKDSIAHNVLNVTCSLFENIKSNCEVPNKFSEYQIYGVLLMDHKIKRVASRHQEEQKLQWNMVSQTTL
ncbi:hypothetical protein AVEN_5475-1 [Araneus ventricosus]|uniref:Uncharacterized protein n=1 Tax=Araneus ventricosus TaxID=182803 RepID=A0A4Y2LWZ7_ARAVE|nr:hypothetical protein AVEN_5475-1 [Araneus ventricosus]